MTGAESFLGGLLVKVVEKAVLEGGKYGFKYGLKKYISGSVVSRAIQSTANDLPHIPDFESSLKKWCESDDFASLLEDVRAERVKLTDEKLADSLVRDGGFAHGLNNTYESASRVLNVFARHLERELYKSEDAPFIEAQRATKRHAETKKILDNIDSKLDNLSAPPLELAPETTTISNERLNELLGQYREHLLDEVSKVRLLGEKEYRKLSEVFVDLNIIGEHERPSDQKEWMGLMDGTLRKRRQLFQPGFYERFVQAKQEAIKRKRIVKPGKLLKNGTRAFIIGAPGCGKTTLFRYIALRSLQNPERLPLLIELKKLSEDELVRANGKLETLISDRFVSRHPSYHDLSDRDHESLKLYLRQRLKEGKLVVLLDGLDEISGANYYSKLQQGIRDFLNNRELRENIVLISTRPYALRSSFSRAEAEEMEVAPLNPRQINDFITHYFKDDPQSKKFLAEINRRSDLRDLASVPVLLGFLFQHFKSGTLGRNRLDLYCELARSLVTQIDLEKELDREWHVKDPDGLIKMSFLKSLAYSRLFDHKIKQHASRLSFTLDDLVAEAKRFYKSGESNEAPYMLANDIKATPLLREIGKDVYCFVHLTLQEYLAAVALSENHNAPSNIFWRAFFDPTLVEMETLPMALGLVADPDDLFCKIEQLPESLNFAGLRLRARALAYCAKLSEERLDQFSDQLVAVIDSSEKDKAIYRNLVIQSLSGISDIHQNHLAKSISRVLNSDQKEAQMFAVSALGQIGGNQSISILLDILKNEDVDLRWGAVRALGNIGTKQVVFSLIKALNDEDKDVKWGAAEALGVIGDELAVSPLIDALKDDESTVRQTAAQALGNIGNDRAIASLIGVLNDENDKVRSSAAVALGQIGSESAVVALIEVLSDKKRNVRQNATEALAKIRGDSVLTTLTNMLLDTNREV